ncbi:MAG: hypothetical protein AMQ22_00707 [Candidatus Methanofastidiosum methylothiophilum]|uniref:Uncharacterized protein n=1 Tax=Candidatus Methanofastidiosum methylothiophilum TaxID=1705564 RepID=A0A150J5Y8_9EURY|nr:MAG: hypothetical protein AMQ22_00707 [Candidatus Methanofastidiosum methylthiophilus]
MRNSLIYLWMFILLSNIIVESILIDNLRNRVNALEQQIKSEQQYSPRDISRLKELFYKENK